ncbi:MAG: helicase-related protein, partial [Gaiellales bacterium]
EEELHSPEYVKIASKEITVDTIEQRVVFCEPREKLEFVEKFLEETKPRCAIVFARTKIGTQRLADDLKRRGHKVRALHGDMSQGSRDSVMIAFRGQRVPLLVATDVAARGLDVSHVTHVINYELPDEAEVYVHRIGRTGRVGREGFAISLVSNKEKPKLEQIERLLKREIVRYGDSAPVAVAAPSEPVEDAVAEQRDEPRTETPRAEGDEPKKRRRRRGGRGRGKGGSGEGAPAPVGAE